MLYMLPFSGVSFDLFCFVFVLMLSLKPRPFVQSSFDMQAPRQPHVFSFFFPFVCLEMAFFPSIFCTIAVFSLFREYLVCSFLSNNDVFLSCDHGLDFLFLT